MGIGGGAAFRDCVYQLQRLDGGRSRKKVDYGNTETSRPESYYQALREWKRRITRFRSGGSAAGAILPF